MITSDTLVIGGGLAGLFSAYVSAKRGRKVTLLTFGKGSFTVASGLIDVLAFDAGHRPVKDPLAAIAGLPDEHPYRLAGTEQLEKAVACFQTLSVQQGLAYHGDLHHQILLPTPIGTIKTTCLAPHSLAGSACFAGKKRIFIVGIKDLKDFYGEFLAENLARALGRDKHYEIIEVDTGLEGGRDLTTLDVARWLDTLMGQSRFVRQLRPFVGHQGRDALFVLPQVLGTHGQSCYATVSGWLGADVIETTALPPSVNGLRLRSMLLEALQALDVDIVENARAIGSVKKDGHAVSVLVRAASERVEYFADRFILATGGFYGGGITMREFEKPEEPVLGLPVSFPHGEASWSRAPLFGAEPQGYAKTGIRTDAHMRPVDAQGKVVLDNVFVCGRDLGGYDLCFEHSGNGVALVSAYVAAEE